MKRFFAVLIALLVSLPFWAYQYKVNVTTTLNLRSEPSASSAVVLKLNNGDIVNCALAPSAINEQTDWVHVDYNGTDGFLKAQYLIPVESPKPVESSPVRMKQWYQLLDWQGDGYRWMSYLIFGLALLMWFECKFLRRLNFRMETEDEDSDTNWSLINGILLAVASCSILIYVALMGSNSLWFFIPNIVNSWWYLIINFIFFVYVLVDLLAFFLLTMKDLAEHSGTNLHLKFGLFTWLGGIIALVICGIGSKNPTYIYLIIAICQVVQVIIIMVQLASKKKYIAALTTSALYLLGSFSITILASCLVFVLIVLVVVGILFTLMLAKETSPGGEFSDKIYITNPEGKRTLLTAIGGGQYSGSDGYIYYEAGWHKYVRR